MSVTPADPKDLETVPKPALESELYQKAGQISGNSIHIHNNFPSQQPIATNISESFSARIPTTVQNVFPPMRHPFHPTTVQNTLYTGTNPWRTTHPGVIELGDPHTAQEVLLKQVRQIVASKVPVTFTDKPLPLISSKPFQNTGILEEIRLNDREVVPDKRPPPVRNDTIPSPQPLGPKNRMGSDDLLSDENIEKMEKSYSDDEGKKQDSDLAALESQEEMENVSQGQNSTQEDDDDHDSFASFLEHETSESMKGDKVLPPSVVSSARNTPLSLPPPEKISTPVTKQKQIFNINNYTHLTQPAPREVIERVKKGTKRAPLDLTDANFPKKSKYSRGAALVPRLQPPKGMNQALHMMRLILQPSFNKELFSLVSDYLEIFYQAAGNITNNGSHDRLDETKVQEMVTGMLSEACRALHGEHQEPKLPKMYLVSGTEGHSPMSRQKVRNWRRKSSSSFK